MNKLLFSFAFITVAMTGCAKKMDMSVLSPGGDIRVTVNTSSEGFAQYSVYFRDTAVIENGRLGIIRSEGNYSSRLKLESVSDLKPVNESYTLSNGKTREADYKAMNRIYHFTGSSGESMDINFQVSDVGVAFCYSFPGPTEDIKFITGEKSSFNFVAGTTGWIQPRAAAKSGWNLCNPSYEEHYLEEVNLDEITPDINGYVFPALFHTSNCWVNITESWPDRNYCGSHLCKGEGAHEIVIAFPEASEGFTGGAVYPQATLPWTTPWRIITMGSTPGVIVESTHGTDLAKAPAGDDFSYVRPGRAAWSWVLMKDPSVNFDVQEEFISYASEMGWEYCLIDANWDTTIGWEKIAELAAMAARKNVGLILWYNSAGDWNTVPYHPKDKLLTHESRFSEFARLEALGIKGIKVDFFGGDGQSMMDYYQDLLADAHEFNLMVNCHGSTLPRGLHRTWPNLVSMEAVRGLEYATFDQESADKVPSKATTLAFTRNAFDPMDFTPVCFTKYDNFERVTGNGAELAMAVLFLSGVQHYGETPGGMSGMPDYVKDMMRDIPVVWDETRFLDGYPGRYLVIARRSGNTWYVGGINAEKTPCEISLPLQFISNSDGILITENDILRSFKKEVAIIDASGNYRVSLEPNGGFVMRFENTLQ
jgi:Glycoside hydrolase 97/Glycosyl-hydrolase 97 N-terminal/Glycosyl-hydrolase 97 C-terminal, oligomerisation